MDVNITYYFLGPRPNLLDTFEKSLEDLMMIDDALHSLPQLVLIAVAIVCRCMQQCMHMQCDGIQFHVMYLCYKSFWTSC